MGAGTTTSWRHFLHWDNAIQWEQVPPLGGGTFYTGKIIVWEQLPPLGGATFYTWTMMGAATTN